MLALPSDCLAKVCAFLRARETVLLTGLGTSVLEALESDAFLWGEAVRREHGGLRLAPADARCRYARCALRTPLETPRQPARQPYLDFVSHLRPIAAATGVALVDGFGATWDAVRAGAFAHHDATRIHFSDSGRRFLAQLALNALSQLLPIAAPLLPLGFLHYSLNR